MSVIAAPSSHRARNRTAWTIILLFVACLSYTVSLAMSQGDGTPARILGPGVILLLFSVVMFFRQGGRVITASSAASYAISMFIAFPAVYTGMGLYWTSRSPAVDQLLTIVNLGFLLQVFILLLCGGRVPGENRDTERNSSHLKDPHRGRWLLISLATLVLAVIASGLRLAPLDTGLGLIAVLFAAVVAFDRRTGRVWGWGLLILGLAMAIYVEVIFVGFGRLVLATIAIAAATIASIALRSWLPKLVVFFGTVPALYYLSAQRLAFLAEIRGASPLASEGIGSVVGPLHSAGQIVDALALGRIAPSYGRTVIDALLVWVPREVWPGKPDGFGREIVAVTQPQLLAAAEFSDAATLVGEAVWNFGVVWAIVLLVAVAVLLKLVDKGFTTRIDGAYSGRNTVHLALLSLISASAINLIWGGFFTATSRLLAPAAVLLVILWATRRDTAIAPDASPDAVADPPRSTLGRSQGKLQ